MKKLTLLSIFLLFGITLFAQNNNYLSLYRQSLYYFDLNDYGKALTFAEDAITAKKRQIQSELNLLRKSLSSNAVKSAGDDINQVLSILEKRNEKDSIAIIQKYIKIKGLDYFDNSMSKLQENIKNQSEYPEAQYLIGKIYQLEGEYDISETYYSMALDNAAVLDVPDFKYEILYNLAEISNLQNDFNRYETRLLNILVEDKYAKDETLIKSMINTIKSNNQNSLERFFMLYRASEYKSIKAYMLLSDYYYKNGYLDKAIQYSALHVITTFTKINDVMASRNTEYEYTNLKNFFGEINNHHDIIEWGDDLDIWKGYNTLAKLCSEKGYENFSKSLYGVLSQYSPQEYWQKDSVLKLSK